MKTSKTFKVIMLPTEKASQLSLNLDTDKLFDATRYSANKVEYQHLYIISEDEIKKGDWVYQSFQRDGKQIQCINKVLKINDTTFDIEPSLSNDYNWTFKNYCKKIVATIDKSLICGNDIVYPRLGGSYKIKEIPESFIQAYIKAYNEGKPITEVDLEMEYLSKYDNVSKENRWYNIKIKTRPDNTVIIHQSKMYSRDEIIEFAKKFSKAYDNICDTAYSYRIDAEIDKWIQDNL